MQIQQAVTLQGTMSDDGLPLNASLTAAWTKVSGPGTVAFSNAASLTSAATFSTTGTYVLRLTVSDTALSAFDEVTNTVNATTGTALLTLTPGRSTVDGHAA